MATQNEAQQQQQKDQQQSRPQQPQKDQQQTGTSQPAAAQPQTGAQQQQAGSTAVSSGRTTNTAKDVQHPIRTSSEMPARRASLFNGGRLLTPWELMRRMNEELDRLVGAVEMQRSGVQATPGANAVQSTARDTRGADDLTTTEWIPRIDVVERDGAMVLRADLAGIDPDDIVVNVENGVLSIWGERQQEDREENDRVVRAERMYGSFFRSIPLPDGADEEHVTAEFKNGVLELTIPVTQRDRGRRIAVKS
jgi:HSP20 family protein